MVASFVFFGRFAVAGSPPSADFRLVAFSFFSVTGSCSRSFSGSEIESGLIFVEVDLFLLLSPAASFILPLLVSETKRQLSVDMFRGEEHEKAVGALIGMDLALLPPSSSRFECANNSDGDERIGVRGGGVVGSRGDDDNTMTSAIAASAHRARRASRAKSFRANVEAGPLFLWNGFSCSNALSRFVDFGFAAQNGNACQVSKIRRQGC